MRDAATAGCPYLAGNIVCRIGERQILRSAKKPAQKCNADQRIAMPGLPGRNHQRAGDSHGHWTALKVQSPGNDSQITIDAAVLFRHQRSDIVTYPRVIEINLLKILLQTGALAGW